MPLDLPPPFEGTLPRSPLRLVACQLRYSDLARPFSAAVVMRLTQHLTDAGFAYPRIDQVQLQNLNIDMNTGVAKSESTGHGWRLQSEDSRWILTVTTDAVTLETTRYRAWNEDFRARFRALIDALVDAFSPATETRLGLRYVDVITDPSAQNMVEWSRWIDRALLGPIAHERLGPGINVIQQQMTLSLDSDVRATVRQGAYPDPARENAPTYLIDIDVFIERLARLDRDRVRDTVERLHEWNLRLFAQMITPEMLEYLRRPNTAVQ